MDGPWPPREDQLHEPPGVGCSVEIFELSYTSLSWGRQRGAQLRAAVLTGTDEVLEVQEVADPAPGADELVLEVEACGICGSDLHLADVLREYPGVIFGHEFAGRVVATGVETEGWSEGDRVVGFPLFGCGVCPACVGGRTAKCAAMTMAGLQRPGAYSQYVTVAARGVLRLPERLSAQHGALVEPLAVALHGLDNTPRDQGDPVLVLGAGPVGLATALWALHFGASQVLVSDPMASRRALAEEVGASTVDPTHDDVAKAFADLTGAPPGTVVECVGVPGLIQDAIDLVAADGRVTVVGACVQPDTIVPTAALSKEVGLKFVLHYRDRDFRTTVDVLASGRLDPLPLITDETSLDQLPARFRSLMTPSTDRSDGKVLVTPNA